MANVQYEQTFPNSCGAASLLCAAIELGTAQLPTVKAYPLWAFPIPLAPNLTCEKAIYSVTSGNDGRTPTDATGYSLPSYIHDCVVAMGRTAVAHVPNTLVGALLKTVYSADVARATGNGMVINSSSAPARPGANQRLLRVMRVGEDAWYKPNVGLHYIMVRPDGSVMDPALGLDANTLEALKLFPKSQAASYIDTGIGVLVS